MMDLQQCAQRVSNERAEMFLQMPENNIGGVGVPDNRSINTIL